MKLQLNDEMQRSRDLRAALYDYQFHAPPRPEVRSGFGAIEMVKRVMVLAEVKSAGLFIGREGKPSSAQPSI